MPEVRLFAVTSWIAVEKGEVMAVLFDAHVSTELVCLVVVEDSIPLVGFDGRIVEVLDLESLAAVVEKVGQRWDVIFWNGWFTQPFKCFEE